MPKPFFLAAAIALVCTAGATVPVRADVTVVSEIRMTGIPASAAVDTAAVDFSKPVASTSYFKGDKSRIETAKQVVITDLAGDKGWTIDPQAKTYFVTVPSKAGAALGLGDNPMAAMLKIDTKTFVNPGGKTETIAGVEAKNYRFMAIFKMSLPGGDPTISQMLPTITLKGEQWASEAVPVPGKARTDFVSQFSKNMPMMAGGLKEFADKMAQIKGMPLASTVTMTFTAPGGPDNPVAASLPKEPIVVTTTAKSVSQEPLSDDLFLPPADYKQVDAPATEKPTSAPPKPTVL